MTPADLARAIHVPANRIYQIVAGKRAITADTAIRLELWLGVEAVFWMNLQKRYELDIAMETTGEQIKATITRMHPHRPHSHAIVPSG
ncbi:MAG: HigA family addiction module antitoxin [Magnetococcus sp. DMHC-8]